MPTARPGRAGWQLCIRPSAQTCSRLCWGRRAAPPAAFGAGRLHTERYHDVLLSAVPRPCGRALDIGCGTGGFARKLATLADEVEAIDRDPGVLAIAERSLGGAANVRFACADFLSYSARRNGSFDFVCALASLHHIDEAIAFERVKSLLRAGGVFAAIGLYRSHGVVDLAWSLAALPVSLALRLLRRPSREPPPLREPTKTLAELRLLAAASLPGATVRRRLLWRYTLVYRA